MRNRYVGNCSLCGKFLKPKEGRWHIQANLSDAQNFQGLRCVPCGTTTKKGRKETKKRLSK